MSSGYRGKKVLNFVIINFSLLRSVLAGLCVWYCSVCVPFFRLRFICDLISVRFWFFFFGFSLDQKILIFLSAKKNYHLDGIGEKNSIFNLIFSYRTRSLVNGWIFVESK